MTTAAEQQRTSEAREVTARPRAVPVPAPAAVRQTSPGLSLLLLSILAVLQVSWVVFLGYAAWRIGSSLI